MPTLISNENYAIRWDKTDCDQYTITNLSDQYNANVTITDETGTYTETFNLGPSETNTIVLPGDGVFKLCAYLFDIPIELEEQTPEAEGRISFESFQPDSFITLLRAEFMSGGIPPPISVNPVNRPLSSGDLFAAELQTWLNANGGGTVTFLEPGETIPGIFVPIDPNNYYIVVQSTVQVLTSIFIDTNPFNPEDELTADSNTSGCIGTYEIQADRQYIFSLTIDGVEIVPANTGWDMSTIAGATAAQLAINTYLGSSGYSVAGIYSLSVIVYNCREVVITTGIYGPGETQCDYIYEFCDLYACLSRLMNRWLCQDPCADKCTAAGESYEEARRKAVELSTMFFHALMPLVTTDRLWYLGNWDISDQRLCNVNNILELYKKMRDYVSNCGFDCGCGCPDNCADCDPCNGYSYAPSPSNPSTPCGCK